jgi:hypothetical protein
MKLPFRTLAAGAAALLLGYFALERVEQSRPDAPVVSAPAAPTESEALARAFEQQQSDVWVEASGVVSKLLKDDADGARHQRFILELPSGQTILIAHNIDLAPRVPVRIGDRLEFRGEYEWNDKGGVVHWTHHDPQGRHTGGWIRKDGQLFK